MPGRYNYEELILLWKISMNYFAIGIIGFDKSSEVRGSTENHVGGKHVESVLQRWIMVTQQRWIGIKGRFREREKMHLRDKFDPPSNDPKYVVCPLLWSVPLVCPFPRLPKAFLLGAQEKHKISITKRLSQTLLNLSQPFD